MDAVSLGFFGRAVSTYTQVCSSSSACLVRGGPAVGAGVSFWKNDSRLAYFVSGLTSTGDAWLVATPETS